MIFMDIRLAYGKDGLRLHLDDRYNVDIIEPRYAEPLVSPEEKIRESLRNPIDSIPLKELIAEDASVGIIFSDITRPVPNKMILPVILDEISPTDKRKIKLFNALGTHRANSDEELQEMLGAELFNTYSIIQNDAFDSSTQKYLGSTSNGNEVFINRELAACDFIILTGFIEPHFFAGFSGGAKAIMPGMAGIDTVLHNHGPKMIANPNASFGITKGNPIWEEITEIGQLLANTFLVNVTLNRDKQVTGVFSGDVLGAHQAGCLYAQNLSMVPIHEAYEIVITTNSGYPLDINLYQSVKGMSAAARIVKPGGSIILAAECRDGIPEHGCYGTLLKESASPQDLLHRISRSHEITPDQWQAQIQAQIQQNTEIYVYSDHLSGEEIESALLKPCLDIEKNVSALISQYGRSARICILPEGPQTIPYLKTGNV